MTDQFDYEALGLPWAFLKSYDNIASEWRAGRHTIRDKEEWNIARVWEGIENSGRSQEVADNQAAYIVHAANLYPELVELARQIVLEDEESPMSIHADIVKAARAILAKAWEAK